MKKYICNLLLCVLLLHCIACEKTEEISGQVPETPSGKLMLKEAIEDLRNSESFAIWLCAHRGNTLQGIESNVPENSLAAIQQAIDLDIDMVELDVRMTSDGVLVLMHDASIDRTTNGSGSVSSLTYEELQQYRLLSGDGLSDETIPTLEEALRMGNGKIYFNLDIANKNIPVRKIAGLLTTLGMSGQVLLYVSDDRNFATDLKAENADLLLHPMVENTSDIEFYTSRWPDVCVMQLSTEDAMEGTLSREIQNAGCVAFSNVVGRYDEYALQGNFSGLVNMINKRIHLVQTDYWEIADEYLVSKGYR